MAKLVWSGDMCIVFLTKYCARDGQMVNKNCFCYFAANLVKLHVHHVILDSILTYQVLLPASHAKQVIFKLSSRSPDFLTLLLYGRFECFDIVGWVTGRTSGL